MNLNPLKRHPQWSKEKAALEAKTNEIAKIKGCDRGTFTVCWGEHELGLTCKCKEEARAALTSAKLGEK